MITELISSGAETETNAVIMGLLFGYPGNTHI